MKRSLVLALFLLSIVTGVVSARAGEPEGNISSDAGQGITETSDMGSYLGFEAAMAILAIGALVTAGVMHWQDSFRKEMVREKKGLEEEYNKLSSIQPITSGQGSGTKTALMTEIEGDLQRIRSLKEGYEAVITKEIAPEKKGELLSKIDALESRYEKIKDGIEERGRRIADRLSLLEYKIQRRV